MEIHVYNTDSGEYISSLSGDIDMLMLNIKEGQDFTLESLPYSYGQWRWIDDKWVADQPS
tara:strand:- start:204 stop:383 length:180 start_codon:yes stop_codon:yes gene_type:complete